MGWGGGSGTVGTTYAISVRYRIHMQLPVAGFWWGAKVQFESQCLCVVHMYVAFLLYVLQVLQMLQEYFRQQQENSEAMEQLLSLADKLSLSTTTEEVGSVHQLYCV